MREPLSTLDPRELARGRCVDCASQIIHDHGDPEAFARLHPRPIPSRVPFAQWDGLAWVRHRVATGRRFRSPTGGPHGPRR